MPERGNHEMTVVVREPVHQNERMKAPSKDERALVILALGKGTEDALLSTSADEFHPPRGP